MENEFSNRISVKNIVLAGMFAAFLAVMSQVSLPMPTGVPITVQVFAVALVGVILGWKRGVLAVLVYILIGPPIAEAIKHWQSKQKKGEAR